MRTFIDDIMSYFWLVCSPDYKKGQALLPYLHKTYGEHRCSNFLCIILEKP
jgi:hypothetical protein